MRAHGGSWDRQIIPTRALGGWIECAQEQRLVRIQPSEIARTIGSKNLTGLKGPLSNRCKNTCKNNAAQPVVNIAPLRES